MFRQAISRICIGRGIGHSLKGSSSHCKSSKLFSTSFPNRADEKKSNDSEELFMKLLQVRPGRRSGDLFDVTQDIFKGRTSQPLSRAKKEEDLLTQRGVYEQVGNYSLSKIPRTGPSISRSVPVVGPFGLQRAIRQVNILNSTNKVRRNLMLTRFHERPGKKRWRIKNERSRRKFDAGIRHLFDLVAEARRKGY
jgi:hypothetical protein